MHQSGHVGPQDIIQAMSERSDGAPKGDLEIVGRPPGPPSKAAVAEGIGVVAGEREHVKRTEILEVGQPEKRCAMKVVIDK